MATDDKAGADFLAQWYNLQQQYLNNLQQVMQPQKAYDPMQAWMAGNAAAANPFASMQSPVNDWMQSGMGPMNALYQQMNDQLKASLLQPFSMNAWPGMQQGFNPAAMGSMNSPLLELMQNLFGDTEREQSQVLLDSLQEQQRIQLEINHLMSQLAIDSLEQLQRKVAENDDKALSDAPQWWMDISKSMFEQAQQSERFQQLQEQFSKAQKKLEDDREQYREVLAANLGLVTEKTYQAMQQQLESLQEQISQLRKMATVGGEAAQSAAEDFTVLNGVGEKLNQQLHEQGIKNLNQLASMSDEMLKDLDANLQAQGKVFQDQWREQAEQFLNAMTGKTTKK